MDGKAQAEKVTRAFVFQFPAMIDAWHDGDTCTVQRGMQPGIVLLGETVRIEGINAPELADKPAGQAALAYAKKLAPIGTKITLVSKRKDKYGRLLARITLPDGSDFSKRMFDAGHAVKMLKANQEVD